jgi:Holliday junction resolvase
MPKMNANYQVGYRAERKAIEILKGWQFLVIRSAKTGGPFDLIGIRAADMIGLQIKNVPFNKVPKVDDIKAELNKIPAPANFRKEIWIWERRRGFHFIPANS